MRRPQRKYKQQKFYGEDITGDLFARHKYQKFTRFTLYFKKRKRDRGIIRTDIRRARPLFRKRTLFGFFFMQKQKLKNFYGHINNRSFRKLIKYIRRKKMHSFHIANICLQYLESRLDIAIKRINFANTIQKSRSLIKNGVIWVNNKIIKTNTYQIKFLDIIRVQHKWLRFIKNQIRRNFKIGGIHLMFPNYFEVNFKIFYALFLS